MQQQLSQMATQIPEDIARLAHEQGLGAPQASYTIMQLRRGWRWARLIFPLGILLFIITFVPMFIDVFVFSSPNTFFPAIILSEVLFITGILALRFTQKTRTLYTCDNGLILKQSAKKFRMVRWDEVETIWQGPASIYPGLLLKSHLYTIRCHDGYSLTFKFSVARKAPDGLSKTFEEQFTRRRLPFVFADYQAGQVLRFGPLSIDRNGITARDTTLPWEQVADVSLVKDRHLVIYKTGEPPEVWLKLPALKIPNLSILLALFQRIRGGQSELDAGAQALADYGITTTVVPTARKIDPLPEGLATLAEEHDLGERRLDQELGRSRLTSWAQIISLLVMDAIAIAATIGFGILSLPSFVSPWNGSFNGFFIEVSLYTFLLTLYITITVIHHLQQIHNFIYIFERGMILKRGQQAPSLWRWEEVEIVWRVPASAMSNSKRQQSMLPQNLRAYTIQLRNGAKYTLTKYNIKQETLGKLIKEQVVPLQLPAAVDAYQAGQTLSFGPVQVSQQGIAVGARLLSWSQVKSVSLQGNKLTIYDITRRKPWCKLPEKKVPNLFLLFALADYARDIAETHK